MPLYPRHFGCISAQNKDLSPHGAYFLEEGDKQAKISTKKKETIWRIRRLEEYGAGGRAECGTGSQGDGETQLAGLELCSGRAH